MMATHNVTSSTAKLGMHAALLACFGDAASNIRKTDARCVLSDWVTTSANGIGKKSGFSLVELSIVLVILGLLTGGILGGQSLIRAAELRSLSSDLSRYSAAYNTFRDKYFAYPGDMTNATAFWGSAGGNGSDATCNAAISAASKAVCNGNGDGAVDSSGAVQFDERFYVWKELANAGLLEGNFLGRSNSGSGSASSTPGVDSPALKMSGTVITPAYAPPVLPSDNNREWFDGAYSFNTFFVFGSSGSPLKPEEAWNLDTKLDDGMPATGRFFVGKSTGSYMPNCATTDVVATAKYNLTDSSKRCGFWFAVN